MYRSRQERLHLQQGARLHSARSWGNRSKLGIEYKDLNSKEYEFTRHKCTCTWCIDSKQHKHLRKQLAIPFAETGNLVGKTFSPKEIYRCLDVIDSLWFNSDDKFEDIEQEEELFWYNLGYHTCYEDWVTTTPDDKGVKTVTLSMKTIGEIYE